MYNAHNMHLHIPYVQTYQNVHHGEERKNDSEECKVRIEESIKTKTREELEIDQKGKEKVNRARIKQVTSKNKRIANVR